MASLSVEEVLGKVFEDEDIEDDDDGDHEKEEEIIKEKQWDIINSWIEMFPAQEGFNRELFKDITKEFVMPVIQQCSVDCNDHGELQPTERERGK